MTIQEFEQELKALSSEITIQPVKIDGMAGIFYKNKYMFGCPRENIYDAPNSSYGVEMPNGKFYPHPTRPQVLAKVEGFLKKITGNKDYHDAFFGEGEYSDAKLAAGGATDSGILIPDDEQNNAILKG